MSKLVKTKDLFICETPYLKELFENSVYPWDMLSEIKDYIIELIEKGLDGYTEFAPGVLVGKNVKNFQKSAKKIDKAYKVW